MSRSQSRRASVSRSAPLTRRRAAAAENYRSCILDCTAGLELAPRNIKTHYRLAAALAGLGKLPEALATASAGLTIEPGNAALRALLDKTQARKAAADAADAKRRTREALALQEKKALAAALQIRKIRTRHSPAGHVPVMPGDAAIELEGDRTSPASPLLFPVMLLYPLHAQTDFIQAFRESQTLAQHLEYMLPLPWDAAGEYTAKSVEAYLETAEGGLVKWGKNVELLRVLSGGKLEVLDGVVRVSIVPKARAAEWIELLRKRKNNL